MARELAIATAGRGASRAANRLDGESASGLGSGWEGPVLLLISVLLFSFGLVMVYSASSVMAQTSGLADYYFVVRQLIAGSLGLILMIAMSLVDYRRLRILAWPLLFATIALLIVVIMPGLHGLTHSANGARRWIKAGPILVQPAEIAKVAIIIWTAALVVKKQDKLPSLSRGLLPFLLVWGFVAGLILLQPNLSSVLIVLLLAALVVFAGGARIGHFLLLALVGVPLLWTQVEAAAYRMRRITAFLDPSKDPAGISYQINQSLIAIGSGGVFGRGFGRGLQKFGFLPEPHNDFLFSMISEEWGFIGAIVIVSMFLAFALVGYRIARRAPDLFGFLMAVGLTNLIVVQAFLHIAVTMALVPNTGVTLPFMSYGGSSLLVCMASLGILLNVARAAEKGNA
jgi:cell division protein FtsW